MASFNVINEGFIPVRYLNSGEILEVSIRKAFEDAHLIESIATNDVFQKYGLICLLTVVAMDMVEPNSKEDIKTLYNSKKFSMSIFDSYVNKCEIERSGCFDLFDSEHPFMQTATIKKENAEQKAITAITLSKPSGNNPMLYCNTEEVLNPKFTYAECVRCLVTLGKFLPKMGGSGFYGGANGDSPYYFIVKGKNLFEDIVVNMVSKKDIPNGLSYNEPKVVWREQSELPDVITSTSLMQGLSFVGRTIKLIPDDDGYVHKAYVEPSSKFSVTFPTWRDPHTAIVESKGKKSEPRVFGPRSEDIGIWREQGRFLDKNLYSLPPTVFNYGYVTGDECELELVMCVYSGYNPKMQAKYLVWKEEVLTLPYMLVEDLGKKLFYSECIETISLIEGLVRSTLIQVDKSYFFQQVHTYIEHILTPKILNWDVEEHYMDRDTILLEWKEYLKDTALKTYELAFDRLGGLTAARIDTYKNRIHGYIGYAEEYAKLRAILLTRLNLVKSKTKTSKKGGK